MAYRKVYFRIHTEGYVSGWSSDSDKAAFKEESRRLFKSLGWTLTLGHNGCCDTVTKGQGEIILTDIEPGTYLAIERDTGDAGHILDAGYQEVVKTIRGLGGIAVTSTQGMQDLFGLDGSKYGSCTTAGILACCVWRGPINGCPSPLLCLLNRPGSHFRCASIRMLIAFSVSCTIVRYIFL